MCINPVIHDHAFETAGYSIISSCPANNLGLVNNAASRLFILLNHVKLHNYNRTYLHAIRNVQVMNDPSTILSSWAEFRLNPPSEHLLNCLRNINDATDIQGEPIFSPRVSSLITSMVASRSYGQELYRLCGFMAAASASGINFDELLFGGRATSARVNQLFNQARIADDIKLSDRHIILTSHSPTYQIDMARSPVIIGLADFICEALGIDIFIKIYERLGQDTSSNAIKTTSNDLSKQIYRFLGEHLPRSSERKISNLLQDYLMAELDDNSTISASDVDNQVILNFWLEKSLDPELSLKLYDTCLRAWITFRQGLDLASKSRVNADSLSDANYHLNTLMMSYFDQSEEDVSISDYRPPAIQSSDTFITEDRRGLQFAIHEMDKPPLDGIKMLNNGEKARISLLVHADKHATALRHSVLRGAVFSQAQNRITQSLRDQPQAKLDIISMMPDIEDAAYSNWLTEWKDVLAVADGTLKTACQRLLEAQHIEGLTILVRQLSNDARLELSRLMQDAASSPNASNQTAQTVFAALDKSKAKSALKAKLAEIKTTARGFRRAGLKSAPAGINDLDIWHDNLARAAELTEIIIMAIQRFIEAIAATYDLDALFRQDHKIFANQFLLIYKSEGYHD